MEKPPPVFYQIEQSSVSEDKELDCMGCLVQIMERFKPDMEAEQINRISQWFYDKHSLPINELKGETSEF